ncbi:competence protein ComEC [Spirosoma lacussanchae]|uniref:ComEC/Rec2 family competence protein n=1 Tax=Spirosoma lacussanchae TaxID=1884249 RepID=UPI001108AEFC|nr:ComEC/Rec2 family competence protein [Spirosoma lacussanchae]
MKGYPFVRYAAALAAGIVLYGQWPDLIWIPVGAAILGLGLFIGHFIRYRNQVVKPIAAVQGLGGLLLLLAAGWCLTYERTASNRPDNLLHLTDTLQAYTGVVTTQPEERAKTYRVELAIRQGRWQTGSNTGHAATAWHPLTGRVIVYIDKAIGQLPRYGELWLVSGSPRSIDPPLNPGEFDYKRYLRYRNIYHQQYLRPFQRQLIGYDPPSRITTWATAINRLADAIITRQVGNRAEYSIINAMILGVRDDLDPALYRAYSAAGAVHILSVSGLHVGILFSVLTFLLSFLIRRPRGKLIMAVVQLLILWFYALVTGLSPPVLRSAGMFSMLIVANALGRQQQLLNTMGASAFFILCFDPYALFSAGFQLSNLAVAGIGSWQSTLSQALTFRYRFVNKLWELTAVALVAQLITFPLGVFYFHQFPTYFLLANPAVMGLSFLLLPLAMATLALSWVPYLNDILGWLLQKTAWLLNWVVVQTGTLPGAVWDGLWLSAGGMLLTYAVILGAVALVLTRQRGYAWATCLAAFLLGVLVVRDEYEQRYQQKLAVHFLPHRTAVSLTAGHKSLLLTDLDTSDTRSYDFYLKNTFGQWGIGQLSLLDLRQSGDSALATMPSRACYRHRDYVLYVWQGKTIMLINKLNGYARWRLPAVVDYCIIRRNALQHWDDLRGRLVARHIIFDDSNKTPLTDRLLAEANQRGLVCYSVRQMGAYVTELK